MRQAGKIGSSLQAEVAIGAPDADYEALASARRRPAVRADHVGRRRVARGDRLTIAVTPQRAREMRALLALARRRRRRPDASDAVRALRCQPVRRGRASRLCVTSKRDEPRLRLRYGRWHRWLWLAAGVVAADQLTKAAVRRRAARWRAAGLSRSFHAGADVQHRRRVQLPRRRPRGWQRWFFSGHRARRRASLIVWLLRARRQHAVLCRPRADPRRRARQSHRPAHARQRGRLPAVSLRGLGVSRRSTSPTARSPSARRC